MKPLDPRLMKYAKAAGRYIVEISLLGFLTAILVVAQAFLISGSLSPVVSQSAPLTKVLPTIGALLAVVILRSALIYFRESRAHRAADQTIAELRLAVLKKSVLLGPRWRARNSSENATLVTRGLDDLDPYFVKFLPQLLLVVTVTPLSLLAILILDFWSALIALFTIPLIPIFMVLIGRLTQGFSAQKLVAMERLGAQLLDLISGLPTLRALGREAGPREHLVRLGRQNTKTTMQTLRIAFLSGGVLEFLATLSVALVAVQVGMRMVSGQLSLYVGLVIIMLAPEVFEPLRQVGAQFHASTNGIAAAEQCFSILETPVSPSKKLKAPRAGTMPIQIDELSVASRGSWAPHALSGTIEPGSITALSGPSGAGKTTTVQILLGFEQPTRGRITVPDDKGDLVSVEDLDLESWHQGISWIPQHPTLTPGSVLSNIMGGTNSGLSEEERTKLEEAASATGFLSVVESLPEKWETQIGFGGVGLSVGQRQRLALTRALVTEPSFLVLDEPTAHLDAVNEEQIVSVLEALRERGSTILVIAHRSAVIRVANTVLEVTSAAATEAEKATYQSLADDYQVEDLGEALPGFLDAAYLPKDDGAGIEIMDERGEKRL